jgi:Fe2+ transport system protein FeoA
MQISELAIGKRARIKSVGAGDPAYRKRLIALGLIPGTELTLSRRAPLGDPIEIEVRGYALSLRQHEANLLQLEEVR